MKQNHLEIHQGAFLSIVLFMGCLGVISPIGSKLGHQVWMLMIPAALTALALLFCYMALCRRLGGRNLAEICLAAFGPRLGKAAIGLYLAIFLFGASYYLLAIIDLWMLLGQNRTPLAVYVLLVLLVCLLVARMGLAALARASTFFVLFYFFMALFDTILLLPEMQWQRILPLGIGDPKRFAVDSLYVAALLFGLLPLAFCYLPLLAEKKAGKKCLSIAMAACLAEFLLANLRNVLLFGDALQFEDYPTYQALRLVEWGNGILRFELFGELAALAMVFLFGALALWAMSGLLATLCRAKAKSLLGPMAIATGALMLYLKSRINYIDDGVLLGILLAGGAIMLILLFISALKLQKTDCQKRKNVV